MHGHSRTRSKSVDSKSRSSERLGFTPDTILRTPRSRPPFQHGSESKGREVTHESVAYNQGANAKEIPFDGTDYSDWRYQMETEFLRHDILRHIEHEADPPNQESTADRRGRLNAFGVIAKSMKPALRHLVTSVTRGDAYAAWKSIERHYQRKSVTNRARLRREFNDLTVNQFNSFEEFKAKLEDLSRLLTNMGDTIDEDTKLVALVNGIFELDLEP